MPDVTIVIPVADYHLDVLPRALASVRAQTIPCEVIPVYDGEKRGAGAMRNLGLLRVKTPFVCFLDADDELLPTFVERTLAVAQETARARQPRYVYTDFSDTDGKRYHPSDCPWMDKRWHAVTTLLPTAWVKEIGGFDEDMVYAEDTELYAHLTRSGHCGVHLPEVLFVYHKGGLRSQQGAVAEVREAIMAKINERYKEKVMGCCGTPPPSAALSQAYGTVKARPKWGMGKRSVIGSRSGRRYDRIDASYIVDIDIRDAQARPDLWELLEAPKVANGSGKTETGVKVEDGEPSPLPSVTPFKALAARLFRPWTRPNPPPPAPLPTANPAMVKPDVQRVTAFAQQHYPTNGAASLVAVPDDDVVFKVEAPAVHLHLDPVFIFPDKDYPSYTDVRRLVELSGFKIETYAHYPPVFWGYADTPDYAREAPIIVLSPEQPPVKHHMDGRVIWWSLEYGGEYEPDLSDWRGEVWASDPAWAKAHHAQFVVMGSHARLNAVPGTTAEKIVDYLMLAYMTPRREALQQQLSDLTYPYVRYPGYGVDRHNELLASNLMLHAHQDDARRAIAPQRFALCAAYHLPLIHEAVPDAGEYADYAYFAPYAQLATTVRDYLAGRYDVPTETGMGERLHDWLCHEWTFRKSVERALKS